MKIEITVTCDNGDLSYEQIKQMTIKASKEINEKLKNLIENEVDFEALSGKSRIQPKGRFCTEDQVVPFQYFLQVYSND